MSSPKPTTRTGSYAAGTAAQLQGRSGNKTQQYLDAIPAEHPGQHGFYQRALTGLPHPLASGQTLSYGQLQDLLNGPQGAAAREAYARQTRAARTPTKEQYLQAAFAQGRADLLARGAANPGAYAFGPDADEALRAPVRATAVANGNFVQPAFGTISNPLAQAQRFAQLPPTTAYVAPGQALRSLPNLLAPVR